MASKIKEKLENIKQLDESSEVQFKKFNKLFDEIQPSQYEDEQDYHLDRLDVLDMINNSTLKLIKEKE